MVMETIRNALKEWSVACRALEEGRQILLLRKGGLLDAEGTFALESARFWLCPTKWHQDANLLQAAHHDLLQNDEPPAREVLRLSAWCEVVQTWALDVQDHATRNKLAQLDHIWSERYLDVRLGYQTEKPIVVMALRVYAVAQPLVVSAQPEYFGCRSWIKLESPLPIENSNPVLNDAVFTSRLAAVRRVLDAC
jgi:hypothetical protein